MITESQIVVRLLAAAIVGLIIGFERERQDHAAGLRTHMILAVGAALAAALSVNLAFWLGAAKAVGDPARLAAQVVSGIGFLGGGVIFRYGMNVRGLTTAASLWTVAIIGLVIGAGFFFAGITATLILLVILTVLNLFEDRLLPSYNRVHINLEADYRSDLVEQLKGILNRARRKMNHLGIERNLVQGKICLDADLRIWKDDSAEAVVNELSAVPGVTQVKLSE